MEKPSNQVTFSQGKPEDLKKLVEMVLATDLDAIAQALVDVQPMHSVGGLFDSRVELDRQQLIKDGYRPVGPLGLLWVKDESEPQGKDSWMVEYNWSDGEVHSEYVHYHHSFRLGMCETSMLPYIQAGTSEEYQR